MMLTSHRPPISFLLLLVRMWAGGGVPRNQRVEKGTKRKWFNNKRISHCCGDASPPDAGVHLICLQKIVDGSKQLRSCRSRKAQPSIEISGSRIWMRRSTWHQRAEVEMELYRQR
jgi:hypothetical protein